jgi:uncharacterized RDD family membrane protein YckC
MSWFYSTQGETVGPVAVSEFQTLVGRGVVTAETLVWREGMEAWKPYREVNVQVPSAGGDRVVCAISQTVVPQSSAVQIGGHWVSEECKEQALMLVREGKMFPGVVVPAGFWIRFAARLIDGIILWVVSMIAILPFILGIAAFAKDSGEKAEFSASSIVLIVVMYAIQFAIPAVYETVMVGRYEATLGKMALGLRVVRPNGQRLTYWRSLGRYGATILSGLTLCIGYLMAAWDEEKRTLHDRVADTRVTKKSL